MAIAMAEREAERVIVMFPFMAYGHLNPFMILARKLEQRNKGYKITIINTPLNIQKLKSSLPSNSTIDLVEIPFYGPDYGLPPNAENTEALCYETICHLFESSEDLQAPFRRLIIDITKRHGGCPPVCIISDMFLGWTVEVAHELGIYHSVFVAGAAYSMAVYFSVSLNAQSLKPEDEEYLLPDFPEAGKIQESQLGGDLKITDGTDYWYLFCMRQFSCCLRSDAILLNSIEGLGQVGATYFSRKMGGNPVWSIGPACSTLNKNDGEQNQLQLQSMKCTSGSVDDNCSSWLGLHPPGSVLYVSFGSQNTILDSQMKELAMGLEESGKPFIWVIRPPVGYSMTEKFQAEWLPDGFEERIRKKNQGLLIWKWAPQKEILSYKSTGAFLSHCGWNSVLECLSQGIPIIGWPLAGEQFFNSHMLEKEVGVCVEVGRGIESAIVEHDNVARVIKMVMENTEAGEQMRRKASEMKVKMEEAAREEDGFTGSSATAMDEFLNTLMLATKKTASPSVEVEEQNQNDILELSV